MLDAPRLSLDLELGMVPMLGVRSPYANTNYAFASDFDDDGYWSSGVQYSAISAMPGYTFTRTGTQGAFDIDGTVDFFAADIPAIHSRGYHAYGALTNLLLNAGQNTALTTQSVTATAAAHTIAFIGTGSVTLSGTGSGTLNGTGATNQVALTFTPTAGSLTVTVTGDVRYAVLMLGNIIVPVPIISTAGASAGIGVSSLRVNDAPASGDQLFFVTVNFTQPFDSSRWAAFWTNAGDTNFVNFQTVSGGIAVQVIVASAAAYDVATANTDPGTFTLVLRRSGGNWRAGWVRNGALTWFSADTAGAFPAGIDRVKIGEHGGSPLGGQLPGVFRKLGSFTTDASILAAVAETA